MQLCCKTHKAIKEKKNEKHEPAENSERLEALFFVLNNALYFH